MLTMRFFLSGLALLGGLTILGISLATGPSVLSANEGYSASQRQLYLDDRVLPDHVAYPILMTLDKVRLESASPSERIYLEVEYGQRRFEYAQELLARENYGLALTTVTKAHKYLFHAAEESSVPDIADSTRDYVLKSLAYQTQQLEQMKEFFPADQDRAVIDQLLIESRAILSI